jgi:hypothetical protein
MTAEQIAQFAAASVIAIYRDEIKAFLNRRGRLFWNARKEDLALLRKRDLAPYAQKDEVPDPLDRETVNTLKLLLPCVLVFKFIDHFMSSQHIETRLLSWIASTVALTAIFRLLIILNIFVPYRAKLLWERLSGSAREVQ